MKDFVYQAPWADREFELRVLGGLVRSFGRWSALLPRLDADDFSAPECRMLFGAISAVAGSPLPVGRDTVAHELRRRGVEGADAMVEDALEHHVLSPSAVETYAHVVLGYSAMRRLQRLPVAALAQEHNRPGETIAALRAQLAEIETRVAVSNVQDARQLADDFERRLDEVQRQGGDSTGLATGLTDLDRRLRGLKPGWLVIVAGRPGAGKTAFGVQVALNVAARDEPVFILSLEMTGGELTDRAVCNLSRVPGTRLGRLSSAELSLIARGRSEFASSFLFVDDRADNTMRIDDLLAATRSLQHSKRLGGKRLALVVVDYLQFAEASNRNDSRVQDVGEISKKLKGLAKAIGAPVIALAQLSRKSEERSDKRPLLSDLRESGSIEQDADVVIGLHRQAVYDQRADPRVAEAIVLKNRHGPTGVDKLYFDPELMRFDDLAEQ